MQVLKFRAWDIRFKIMISDVGAHSTSMNSEDDQRFVVMQYTGLNDRAGNDIYEGDIIDMFTGNRRRPIKRVVVAWQPQLASYNIRAITDKLVVGNIYQNPDRADGVKL